MGGFISTPLVSDSSPNDDIVDHSPSTVNDAGAGCGKRARLSSPEFPNSLLPGLPDDVSIRCLARVSRSYHNVARLVSRGWAQAFASSHLYTCRRCVRAQVQFQYQVQNLRISITLLHLEGDAWHRRDVLFVNLEHRHNHRTIPQSVDAGTWR